MRVWGINQPSHLRYVYTLLVFSTSRLCGHLVFAVPKWSAHLSMSAILFISLLNNKKDLKTDWYGYNKPQKVGQTQYLAICLQTICCVSLIHRSSQSQRNRWKLSFRQVQQLLCNYFMLVWAGYIWLEYYVLIVAFQEALLAMTQSPCCVYQNKITSLLKEIRTILS